MEYTADDYFQKARKIRWSDDEEVKLGIAYLNQAARLDPTNMEYRMLRGDYFCKLNEYQQAIDDFTLVIQSGQDVEEWESKYWDWSILYGMMARCHEGIGQSQEQLKDLDWLVDHGYDTEITLSWRGSVRLKLGDIDGAIKDFEMVSQLSPDSVVDQIRCAWGYYAAERYDDALRAISQGFLLERSKNSVFDRSVLHYWRGKIYYRLGRDADALDECNESMRLEGKQAFTSLAECVEKLQL
ncbi:MAG: tetratricopeptide repeat protein [Anaerolineae bacterium]|nr:tetratricopeptide repeat protein [Anaerolineae bacterium]